MMDDSAVARLTDEVVAIKKLLIYALRKNGVTQDGIAAALGVDQSAVSRMLKNSGVTKRPSGARRKVKEGANA